MTDPRITERLDRQLALRAAVLLDAMRCLVEPPNSREQAFARLAAWRWVRSHDAQAPFSFENICESLGFDPRRVRQEMLKDWHGQDTNGEQSPALSIRRARVARVVRRRLGRTPSPTPGTLSPPALGMIIDPESFRELTAHLECVSRGILRTTQHLAAVSQDRRDDDEWSTLLDRLMAIVMEMIVVDKLVNALAEANRQESQRPPVLLHRD